MTQRKTITVRSKRLSDKFNASHGNREEYTVTGYKELDGRIYALSLAGYTLYQDSPYFEELAKVYVAMDTGEKAEVKQEGMTEEVKRQVLEGVFHSRHMSSSVDEDAKELLAAEFAANFDNRFNEIFGG